MRVDQVARSMCKALPRHRAGAQRRHLHGGGGVDGAVAQLHDQAAQVEIECNFASSYFSVKR